MLLEAQIFFRLGKFDACIDIYQKLQKSKVDLLDTNYVASLVAAGRATEVQVEALKDKAKTSFELAFNTACSLIERNMYTDAEQFLLLARR